MNRNKLFIIKILAAALALLMLTPLLASCMKDGADGLSAYEIALKNGATTAKSEQEWLASLKGEPGEAGKSAYELACGAGFTGTVEEWLASLRGADGKDGSNGKSAYEVAVANGFTGTEAQWVAELLGSRSDSGTGSGVGISTVYINADRHLIVRLTNSTIIDAGFVGAGGSDSSGSQTDPKIGTIDSDGYTVVDQTVVVIAGSLNIRTAPDISSSVVAVVTTGTELHRVGIGTGDITWSKVIYDGKVCYASTKYLEVKSGSGTEVDLTGIEIPKVNLMDSYILLVGKQMCFVIDQFVVGLASDMYASFNYSGTGTKKVTANSIAITPTAAETADLTFSIRKYIDGGLAVIYSKTVKLISINAGSVSLRGLVIGDSRISDGTLVDTLKANFGSSLTLMGTLKTGSGNAHEGRGAWSVANYAVYNKTSTYTNPFYNPAKSKFDFGYYLSNTSQASPDFVVFDLGANDNYSSLSIVYYKNIVDSILEYNRANGKSVKILIMTEYLAPLDGYSLSYCPDIAVKRDLQFEYFNMQFAAFGGRESEGIYLIPNYVVVDNSSDRTTAETSVSDRSGGTVNAISDVIHLSASGYKKEADVLTAYIYSIFAAN
jgi:lysophospholipase L1-like esterase